METLLETQSLPEDVRPSYREPSSILRRGAEPDRFTNSLYSFSPYQACAHACAYCDGRAERYWVEGGFSRDIVVRRNLPEMLSKQLGAIRERGIVSIGSGITDIYQPIETTERLMECSAQILAQFRMPSAILTKSALIDRDLELWKQVASAGGLILHLTITSLDEQIQEIYEPGAAKYAQRLNSLRLFRAAGIHAGILAMPILPYISDCDTKLRALFTACRDAGAEFIMPGGLTLRPGRQKEHFFNILAEHRPDLLTIYRDLYGEDKQSGMPRKDYHDDFRSRSTAILGELKMPIVVPHYIYRPMVPRFDEISILLGHMEALYASAGIDIQTLRKSAGLYGQWLQTQRNWFRRKRSLPDIWLEERFTDALESGEIDRVLNNSRLTSFVKQIAINRNLFDYTSRSLIMLE